MRPTPGWTYTTIYCCHLGAGQVIDQNGEEGQVHLPNCAAQGPSGTRAVGERFVREMGFRMPGCRLETGKDGGLWAVKQVIQGPLSSKTGKYDCCLQLLFKMII